MIKYFIHIEKNYEDSVALIASFVLMSEGIHNPNAKTTITELLDDVSDRLGDAMESDCAKCGLSEKEYQVGVLLEISKNEEQKECSCEFQSICAECLQGIQGEVLTTHDLERMTQELEESLCV